MFRSLVSTRIGIGDGAGGGPERRSGLAGAVAKARKGQRS